MSLHIVNSLRIHPGNRLCRSNYSCLSINARSRIPETTTTVIVDGRPSNDRFDTISILESICQSPQNHNSHAITVNGALGLDVKGTTMSVRGKNSSLVIAITRHLRNGNGNTTRDCHLAISA